MSPEYYWSRVFELPLNSINDVLKVLPNQFEEFIDIKDLKFYAKRIEKNKFLCFAYNESKILNSIDNSGLTLGQINNINFAQIELESFFQNSNESCIKIDGVCLSYIDNKLVQIPLMLKVDINNDIDISEVKLSSNSISLNYENKYIDGKTSYIYSVIFVLFALLSFIKLFSNNQVINDIDNKILNIQSNSSMPSTSIQTKSIIKKLKKVSNKQLELRELFKYIFNINKMTKGTILSFDFKNDIIILKVKDVKAKKLTKYLEKKYTLDSATVKDKIVTIGFKL